MDDRVILEAIAVKISDAIDDPKTILDYDDSSGRLAAAAIITRPAYYAVQCLRTHINVFDWEGSNINGWRVVSRITLADPECIEKAIDEVRKIRAGLCT